jgi:hypothetical protein
MHTNSDLCVAVQSSELAYGEADGDGRGFLSFFAVHGTSIYEV